MRFFLLIAITLSFSSCGKNPSAFKTENNERSCVVNLDTNRCDPIQGNEGSGIEILETVLEVPINIQGEEITFLAGKNAIVVGKKLKCEINISKGEIHRFELRGDKLLILSPQGSFEFENQSEGEGLGGHWVWKGYVDNGILEIRQLYFVGKNRLILRKTCEF
jgi:hypothetical protein